MSTRRFFLALFLLAAPAIGAFGQQTPVTPQTALRSYLNNGDATYAWEIRDSLVDDKGTIYRVLLTSQQWREHTWRHQLNVVIPNDIAYDGGLLFISGGRMEKSDPNMPHWSELTEDELTQDVARIAVENKAVAAVIRQVPNQP